MQTPSPRAPQGSALLTDFYQLTMAQGYWKTGKSGQEAVFHLFFREHPFGSGFTLTAGLEDALRYLRGWRFSGADLDYLAALLGPDGRPLFVPEFLESLRNLRFTADVDAVPEGTVVFPHEPLLRVQGPILQAQLVETALLNILNFQSLIATKAARICQAAQGDPVIEFGLRRAQGFDGGLSASRAAFIGGCAGTSNVLAGQQFGLPVRGTHAHSWVMAFDDELEAFEAYADANPRQCVFLVDTVDSLEGVRRAVVAGRRLRERGHELAGIRLDSGDLVRLSREARAILDAGAFPEAAIVASNDLDEHLITALKQQGAAIQIWGVGTRLVTAYDQPALGGVYKLAALRRSDGSWDDKFKLSEQPAKSTIPGVLQVRRFGRPGAYLGDAIFDVTRPWPQRWTIVEPGDRARGRTISADTPYEDLLVPVLRQGRPVVNNTPPGLEAIRERARNQLAGFDADIRRLVEPGCYPAGLEESLDQRRDELARLARNPTAFPHRS